MLSAEILIVCLIGYGSVGVTALAVWLFIMKPWERRGSKSKKDADRK
jgi:hypothetical protein